MTYINYMDIKSHYISKCLEYLDTEKAVDKLLLKWLSSTGHHCMKKDKLYITKSIFSIAIILVKIIKISKNAILSPHSLVLWWSRNGTVALL